MTAAWLLVGAFPLTWARADELARRLFDFTPLSAANPAVVTIDDTLTIPLSELHAYRATEKLGAIGDPSVLNQRHAILNDLIDEYLLVDDAYRAGVPDSDGFRTQMEATRTMILTDFLATRARDEALARKPGFTGDAAADLADQLFEAAPIEISNEAFAIVQQAAAALDTVRATAAPASPEAGPDAEIVAQFRAIIVASPEAVAVRYEGHHLTIRQILGLYAGLPTARPEIGTHDGFVALIKPFITPELMAAEAVRRGIAAEPEFQHKLIQNRNALLRFHAHGLVEARANDLLHDPALATALQSWYQDHGHDYRVTDADGERRLPSLASIRGRVLADYSVDLCERLLAAKTTALRASHHVVIHPTGGE